MTTTHLAPSGTLHKESEQNLNKMLDDLLAQAKAERAAKRKTEKEKKKRARILNDLLPPAPPQTEERPVAIVLFMTRTTCLCGNEMSAPTFGSNSTFIRRTPFRIHIGYKRCKAHPIPHAVNSHVLLPDPKAAPLDLPYTTEWVYERCVTCPECHGRDATIPLPLPPVLDAELCKHEAATRAFYASLLSPPDRPDFRGGTLKSSEDFKRFKTEVESYLRVYYDFHEALEQLPAEMFADYLTPINLPTEGE